MADLDLNELERLALKATPQQFDTAEVKRENGVMDCPICHGEGSVDTEADYCNYDGRAIGVEFYGIGKEFGAAERYYRAARPAIILAMIARIRELEQRAGVAKDAEQIADLVLGHAEGLRVSSPLETRNGFGSDVEHCFEVSDGSNRFGVVIILTRLKAAAAASHTQQQEGQ